MTPLLQPTYERAYTADPAHPGAMLAFLLDEDTIQALQAACAPLEVTPDHVTLVYLTPDAVSQVAHKSELIRWIAEIACSTPPIEGAINGFGRFLAAEGEDTSAIYASVDCPTLPSFRERLHWAACMAGCEPVAEHGFVPHTTLTYLPTSDATPSLDLPAIPLRFSSFALVWGDETITFPFSENMPMADEYRSVRTGASQYLRAYAEPATEADDPAKPIRFVASTEGVKSDGKDLRMKDWRFTRFNSHPVVLWGHDYMGRTLPIGTGKPIVEGSRLLMDVSYDTDDEFAMRVRAKVRKGMIAGSVSWEPTREGNELLEFSMVPLPVDPQSLPVRQARALQDTLSALTGDTPTTADPPTPAWPEVAADMAALILFPASRSISAWRKEYSRLARLYDQLGKEPPERLAPDYLAALDNEAVSGLFLEDEKDIAPDLFTQRAAQTAPQPLTAADRADLAHIVERLQGVLARADAPQPITEPEPAELVPEADQATAPELLSLASILGVRS